MTGLMDNSNGSLTSGVRVRLGKRRVGVVRSGASIAPERAPLFLSLRLADDSIEGGGWAFSELASHND